MYEIGLEPSNGGAQGVLPGSVDMCMSYLRFVHLCGVAPLSCALLVSIQKQSYRRAMHKTHQIDVGSHSRQLTLLGKESFLKSLTICSTLQPPSCFSFRESFNPFAQSLGGLMLTPLPL